jgi:hypothetical protein
VFLLVSFADLITDSFFSSMRATRDITVHRYQALANAFTDTAILLRFLSLATETHVHPLVLQVVADHVQNIIASMML